MMKPRDQARSRRPVRETRHTVLVYCGAVRTEPDYLNGLKSHVRGQSVTVRVRAEGIAPDQLVRAAANYRDQRPGAFDDVWCVVDVDEFDISAAVVTARRRKIHLAVSNPCFELWLLLHHTDCRGHCAGYHDVVTRLRCHVPTYDKTRLKFADFAAGIGDAVKRARDLDPSGTEYQRNPSTNVWRLVEMIMEK